MALIPLPGTDTYVRAEHIVFVERVRRSGNAYVEVAMSRASSGFHHRNIELTAEMDLDGFVNGLDGVKLLRVSESLRVAPWAIACTEADLSDRFGDEPSPVLRVVLTAEAGGRVVEIAFPELPSDEARLRRARLLASALASLVDVDDDDMFDVSALLGD